MSENPRADSMLALARQVLAAQPFSVFINADITEFAPGITVLVVPITDNLKQQHGYVHGGVVSYAADNAITFAAGTALGANVVTSEYKINYVAPAIGERLIARAAVVHAGKRQAVCRCDVFTLKDGEEILCAVAQGTISRLGGDTSA